MESIKLVMGAAVVGIFLGVAGLVFGVVSKNKADELRSDFSQVQVLVEKIQQVEESSTGISASATRIRREVDSLRDGTQGALNQVSDELTRLRRDLNESIALARGLERKVAEFERAVPELPAASPPTGPAVGGNSEQLDVAVSPPRENDVSGGEAEGEIYVIQRGDTLTRVAAEHGITLSRLTAANSGIDPNRLQVGQRIRIPTP